MGGTGVNYMQDLLFMGGGGGRGVHSLNNTTSPPPPPHEQIYALGGRGWCSWWREIDFNMKVYCRSRG